MIKAIPTIYAGITYRSRTEARWARFWQLTHTPFIYEPEGYRLSGDWYVPDFLLCLPNVYFEVKPTEPTARELRVARLLAVESGRPVVIACGAPGANVKLVVSFSVGGNLPGFLVQEHEQCGAWLVGDTCGGEWSMPLGDGLHNPAAYCRQHDLLDEAGALQFNKPEITPDPMRRVVTRPIERKVVISR